MHYENGLSPQKTLEFGRHILLAHDDLDVMDQSLRADMQAKRLQQKSGNLSFALANLENVYYPNVKVRNFFFARFFAYFILLMVNCMLRT